MSRLHVHIAVDNLEQNIRFYRALFGCEPTVSKPDYAKWELADPAVNFAISSRGNRSGVDHIGIQADSDAELAAIRSRLEQANIAGREQPGSACCYARSDKYWTQDPQGIAWESFHTLGTIPTFNSGEAETAASGCCVPALPTSGGCC